MDKSIILVPNQAPQFNGSWTIGEIRQMAQGLLAWLDSIPLNIDTPQPDKIKNEGKLEK